MSGEGWYVRGARWKNRWNKAEEITVVTVEAQLGYSLRIARSPKEGDLEGRRRGSCPGVHPSSGHARSFPFGRGIESVVALYV